MTTFVICLIVLVASYFLYGALLEKVASIDANADVPSKTMYDGVDYLPLPRWRIFLIQLLNIAGTGPIFGAILGACYGPVAFLWITLGGIFMGAMHDYLSGVISLRNEGRSLPDIIWRYFAWSNQALSVLTLWMISAWLYRKQSRFVALALIPALIMTYVCSSFIFVSNQFIGMGSCTEAYVYAAAVTAVIAGVIMLKIRKDIRYGATV